MADPHTSEDIARVVAEEHGGPFNVTWEDYHPLVLTVVRWLIEHDYLEGFSPDDTIRVPVD